MPCKVYLEELTEADTSDVFTLSSDADVAQYMRFERHTELSQAAELVRAYCAPKNIAKKIIEKGTDNFVGVLVLHSDGDDGVYDITMYLKKSFWGKGYGSVAVECVQRTVADTPDVKKLMAYVVKENIASRAILIKSGFLQEKIMFFPDLPNGLYVYGKAIK